MASMSLFEAYPMNHMWQRAQEYKDLFRLLVESSADGLVLVDRSRTLRFMNPAAERLFGYPAAQMVGCPFEYVMEPGQTTEFALLGPACEPRTIEMRVAEMRVNGETLYIASLRDITELVQAREKLRAMSLVDDLTGLYNRRGFFTLARQRIDPASGHDRTVLVLFVDLDGLKVINDTFGHHAGDEALVVVAGLLRQTFRQSDLIARMGGDEFAVMALVGSAGSANLLAERFQQKLAAHNAREEVPFPLSVSVGMASAAASSLEIIDMLMREADALMYAQKRGKRAP